jgi:hypothetical protein
VWRRCWLVSSGCDLLDGQVIRRLLAALLLAPCAVVVLTGAPAIAACPALSTNLQQRTMGADAIFTGTVVSRAVSGNTATFTVDVDRIYKGTVAAAEATVSTDVRARACGLPGLVAGTAYVFFAQVDGSDLTLDRRGGTATASDAYVARVEGLLGAGHAAVPPAPVEATFTTVADAPADVQRVAAPGAALVIVGLLGLVLVAWRARRRG